MNRILMIDDEPALLLPHRMFLEHKGCAVDTAETAAQAVLQLSRGNYQLVLLDVKMPKLSGFDLCGELKHLTSAPIVFFSSMTEDDDQVQGFLAGGADYISKGCSLELFWARVSARLSQAEQADAVRHFPPLSLDVRNQRALIGEEDIRLTATEFKRAKCR